MSVVLGSNGAHVPKHPLFHFELFGKGSPRASFTVPITKLIVMCLTPLDHMRILVIGGTGSIGIHVTKQLAEAGHDVCVLHRGETKRIIPTGVRTIAGCDRESLRVRVFPEDALRLCPDAVIHMIAMNADDARAAVSAFKGRAGRLVMISSGDVYLAYGRFMRFERGEPVSLPLHEHSALRSSLHPYRTQATSEDDLRYRYDKIPVEQTVMMAGDKLPSTVLRLPKVYGPDQNADLATVYRYRNHPEWSWTHGYVENVAAAIALAATHPKAANEIFNVGEEQTPTNGERLQVLPPSVIDTDESEACDFRQSIVYCTKKIRRTLGYREPITYEEGLRRTLAGACP